MKPSQDKCPATAWGQSPGSGPTRVSSMGNSSSEKAQGPVWQGAEQGPATRDSSTLHKQGCSPESRGRTGLSPSAQHSLDHIWVLRPVLGPCSMGKTLTNWSEFSRCH